MFQGLTHEQQQPSVHLYHRHSLDSDSQYHASMPVIHFVGSLLNQSGTLCRPALLQSVLLSRCSRGRCASGAGDASGRG